MRFSALFLSLLPLLPLALAGPLADAEEFSGLETRKKHPNKVNKTKKPFCSKGLHIIACSGHGAPMYGNYGLLSTTVDDIKAAVPRSSNFSVPYDKNSTDFPTALAGGADLLQEYIQNYTSRCPTTPIVLLGYSEGAMITMNTLCGTPNDNRSPLDPYYAPFIIATVVYGDETRVPNQPYDLGTCTSGRGTAPRKDPTGCYYFQSNMQSYCDSPDPQCCGGNNQSVHYTYPATYDSNVTTFVYNQYTAYRAAQKVRLF